MWFIRNFGDDNVHNVGEREFQLETRPGRTLKGEKNVEATGSVFIIHQVQSHNPTYNFCGEFYTILHSISGENCFYLRLSC